MPDYPTTNRQVRLASRPDGIPEASHFEIVEEPVPALETGQFLVRNDWLSVDPAMRGWVNAMANYSRPVAIGEVMRAYTPGEVIASRNPGFPEGDKGDGPARLAAFRGLRRPPSDPQGARRPTCRFRSRSGSSG